MSLITIDSNGAVAAFERAHREQAAARRRRTMIGAVLFILAFAASVHVGEVSVIAFIEGLPGLTNYLSDITPPLRASHLTTDLAEWYWGLGRWLLLLGDTIVIAFLATVLGIVGASLLCFVASRNLAPGSFSYFLARRLTEIARAVPELVYALIFVYAFGLGPLAGVLAIAVHTSGALGKLFSEVNENIDSALIDSVRAVGGNWFHVVRFAVLPQVLPVYASYTLLRFEINVRGAAVIGFVGAGGIGQELMYVIRQFIYADISAIVVMIILSVVVIDLLCERIRHRFIGQVTLQ